MGIKISGNKISANSKDTSISYASILNSGVGGVSTKIQVPQSATAEIPSENFITITCNGGPAASQQINPNISGCKIDFKTLEIDKEYTHKLTSGREEISGATIEYTIEVQYTLTHNNIFNIRFKNTLNQSNGSLSLGFNDKTMVINDYTPSHEIIGDIDIKGDINIENEIKTSSFHSTAPLMAKKNIFKVKVAHIGTTIGGLPAVTFQYVEGLPILSSPDSNEYLLTSITAGNETIFVEPTSLNTSSHYRPALIPITLSWNNQIPMQTTTGVIRTDWYLIFTKDGVTASTGFNEVDFNVQTFTFTQYYLLASTIN